MRYNGNYHRPNTAFSDYGKSPNPKIYMRYWLKGSCEKRKKRRVCLKIYLHSFYCLLVAFLLESGLFCAVASCPSSGTNWRTEFIRENLWPKDCIASISFNLFICSLEYHNFWTKLLKGRRSIWLKLSGMHRIHGKSAMAFYNIIIIRKIRSRVRSWLLQELRFHY